ncbi:hypothetical protein UFOVP1304_28 [uncultured Caudovirales phage]|uniref:Uncharacterized protein n=1 Tax=uncultured Caudovirales phage TaxID=2100421 RepID=A0A6J5RYF6_9CAUD|nr:hypothetical protein UFOVP1304_28 [uncultured Caudovirales phage]
MPKNTRRVTVTRAITYTTTIDVPGYPEETDVNLLVLLGGAAGNTGTLSLGELLAGSNLSNNGAITRPNWAATGTSINVEPYITRPQNTALTLGQRIASITPPTSYEAALGKLFVVSVAGTTQNVATEPTWTLTDGGTTTDGTVTLRTVPKFPTLNTFAAATVYAIGAIVRPVGTSLKEFLVTTATTASTTAPTWTSIDTLGAANSLPGAGAVICIAGCTTYAFQSQFSIGDVVKPGAASSEEYLVTVSGKSDTTALTTTVGASVTRGTATFKRIV